LFSHENVRSTRQRLGSVSNLYFIRSEISTFNPKLFTPFSNVFSDSPPPRKHPKGSGIHSMPAEILSTLRRIMEICRVNKHSQYIFQ
jgi:hypothetical protein